MATRPPLSWSEVVEQVLQEGRCSCVATPNKIEVATWLFHQVRGDYVIESEGGEHPFFSSRLAARPIFNFLFIINKKLN